MDDAVVRWVRVGAMAGLLAVAIYSTFFFVPWSAQAGVVVASLFGILLAVGCTGLRVFLTLERRSVAADVAGGLGILAGLAVMLMLIVQLAIRNPAVGATLEGAPQLALAGGLDRVHFGLDVVWDILIAGATLLFAVRAWRHPRLGPWFAVPGVAVAVALVATNLVTFPFPPAAAGSVDVGPAIGLWYVAVSIRVLQSMPWVRGRS